MRLLRFGQREQGLELEPHTGDHSPILTRETRITRKAVESVESIHIAFDQSRYSGFWVLDVYTSEDTASVREVVGISCSYL